MEAALKQLMKEALLEALVEYFGETEEVATYGRKTESSTGSNTGANSGGTPGKDGRPKPDVGVGTFSLR